MFAATRRLLTGLLISGLGFGAAAAGARDDQQVARIEAGLRPKVQVVGRDYPPARLIDQMKALSVPAVSIAFVDQGRIAWTRTWGVADLSSGRRADVHTLFQAASMSKPVAATAALAMVDDGVLTLDRPVNARLKGWKIPENALTMAAPVTLRQLLGHTAGLTVGGFPGYGPGEAIPTVSQILDGAAPARTVPVVVDQPPGLAYRYSGGGYTVLQQLMSDASGEDFAVLMDRRILGRLGMKASGYRQPLPSRLGDAAASGYRGEGQMTPGRFHTYPELAAAGLWTTPSDLALWLIALEGAYRGEPGAVLRPETARAMLTPGLGGWGLGVGVAGEGRDLRFFHGGSNDGFRGMLIGFPERRQGVVVMTNADKGGVLVGELVQAIAEAYGWPGFEPTRVSPVELPAAVMAGYEGVYASSYDEIRLTRSSRGDTLRVLSFVGEIAELVPQGPDRFVENQGGTPVVFERGADGAVASVMVRGVARRRLSEK
ncbi:penicillin-binding protein, beta-lactamase class C [Caulobacter sp. AP07]|uniref:serine hydrolase domain-containing protein n=1 Tax=Caulobacter sp. AP07 TaxID=1144304 RepID=UPI0002720C7C|nr:hydrolase [Caulobacter sp. AP07]EJL25232.1 penicillin-binding protein, beta-lactamase class C [Caulobacter sp. AP07]